MVGFVRDHLIAPGRPLHDRFLAHEDWLNRLGVPPADPSIGIYGVPTARIVAEIRDTGVLGANNRAFLAAAPDTVAELRRVLNAVTDLPVRVAADFVALCADEGQVRTVLGHAPVPSGVPVEEWLLELHDLVEPTRRASVVTAGLEHFTRIDSELPTGLLVLALRTEADGTDPTASTRRKVLVEAAARLEVCAREPRAHRDPLAGGSSSRPGGPGGAGRWANRGSSTSDEGTTARTATSGAGRKPGRNTTPNTPQTAHLVEPGGADPGPARRDEGSSEPGRDNAPPWGSEPGSPTGAQERGTRRFPHLPLVLALLGVVAGLVLLVFALLQIRQLFHG
jgi:hypothetical protein